ncbi:EH domain-binding protein 1 isoform X2 [Condylostylus longicornis]|uniref:EH domain-binding protein 1 isoform X2 n=1 Tax=Condylostylus longicornis TaxID=2530218 RepID=UPI00244DB35D|nr:EH domain-binding protein 1 isoform X2 [Condylostylus longicornis]
MGSVWKRLQRVNKRAAKFQFTASYHELRVETTAKWRPTNLSVVWTRRSRRVASVPLAWEPDMMSPLIGHVSWPVPDNHAITVTLFKDPRTHELEDKDWTFVIEDITQMGKKRVLASASINMRKYASIESTQQSFTLNLKPSSRKITSANLELTISCVFLREGKATDEDMQSVISMMSVNNNCDVAPLDDLEDIPDLESDISDHVFDFTQQLEQLTNSLNGPIDLPTPMSVPSLSEDPTPLAESNNVGFELELDKSSPKQQQKQRQQQQQHQSELIEQQKNQQKIQKQQQLYHQQEHQKSSNTLNPDQNINQQQQLLITPVNTKPPDELDKVNTPIINTELIEDSKLNNKFKSKEPVNSSSIVKDVKIPDDKIEVIVNETKNSDNKKCSEIQINLITSDKPSPVIVTTNSTNITNPKIINNSNPPNSENITENRKQSIPEARDTKRSELLPLNLRKSYENTEINNKVVEKINLKERTPGQDLLEWCKDVTKDYPNVKVTNLTTSWRNGMAFCAIIHHFEPELIDMSKLSTHDVVGNCRIAFDVAEKLGIPRVIEPRDMSLLAVPDKLAVMTYLHQLRAHFTGKQLQIEQIGQTSDESSYVIGNYKTDNLSQNILNLNMNHLKMHFQHNSLDEIVQVGENGDNKSPTSKKDVKNLILSGSKNLLVKVLSPTKDKNATNALHQQHLHNQVNQQQQHQSQNNRNSATINNTGTAIPANNNDINNKNKPILMTRRQLTDPFGSDDEDDKKEKIITKEYGQIDNQKINSENSSEIVNPQLDPLTANEERQQRLREHARRLIAETRLKSHSLDSPTSPIKQRPVLSPERTISPINVTEGFVFNQINGVGSQHNSPQKSPTKRITPPRDGSVGSQYSIEVNNKHLINDDNSKLSPSLKLNNNSNNNELQHNNSPLQSFNSILDRISPKNEKRGDKLSYIESELEALEREQEAIDQKASSLEKKLRAVMGDGNSSNKNYSKYFLKLLRPGSSSNSVGGGGSSSCVKPKYNNSNDNSNSLNNSENNYYNNDDNTDVDIDISNSEDDDDDEYGSGYHTARNSRASIFDEYSSDSMFLSRRRKSRSRSKCEEEESEEQLLSQWFTLVNKKNALLRRQMQLNILEQENDLERKYELLNQELRAALSVEDWRKSEAQRKREDLLLEELVEIVNKRDQLVQHLHSQEKAIEDDDKIERELENVDISGKDKCILQ